MSLREQQTNWRVQVPIWVNKKSLIICSKLCRKSRYIGDLINILLEAGRRVEYLKSKIKMNITYGLQKIIKNKINYFWPSYVTATQTVGHNVSFFFYFRGFAVFLPSSEGALSSPSFLNSIMIGWWKWIYKTKFG